MEQTKRLYRSRYDSVIAGVAGGLAKYFNIDPIIFRILFVALVFAGASGVLIYIILWIAVPLDPDYTFFKYNRQTGYKPTMEPPQEVEPDMEKKDEPQSEARETTFTMDVKRNPRNEGSLIAGIIFIVLGSIFLFARIIPGINMRDLWPLLLIAAGILVMRSAISKPKINS
ncbi:MAG: PspC domain-containing protein [Bacteroidales bacterium]|nr:PspC domain-containing protein [Bacteroidales bacterium]